MLPFNENQSYLLSAVATGALITGGIVWSMTKPCAPIKIKDIDFDNQTSFTDEKNFIRSSPYKTPKEVSRGNFKNIRTLYDVFQCGLAHGENEPCLGYKTDDVSYQWITYREVDNRSINVGAGIIKHLNQAAGQNTKIGIFMKNCVEWVYVEQACTRYSMVLLPLYDTLGEEACRYMINRVKCEVIFVDTKKKIDFLLKTKSELPNLKYIVTVEKVDSDTVKAGETFGVRFSTFSELMEIGSANPTPLMLPKSKDKSTILYTSGTTGVPKGCIITHQGVISGLSSALNIIDVTNFGKKKEVHLSFLPLTHLYEKLVQVLMFMFTGRIAFFSKEIRFLIDEMKIVKPTILFAVPRILNRIYNSVTSEINKSPVKKFIFEIGLSSKMEEVKRGIMRRNSVWDYLIFRKIQAILGGDIDFIMVGSAPVSGDVINFFRAVMGCIVIEGYGQSETTGPITITIPGDNDVGHVGVPASQCQIKLCDVPDLDIIVSRDLRGEICVKGDMCITGYYEDPELTKTLIDSEGWLHTGDVGLWTNKGQLKIVDRCKHIFKLAQGEYLAPEKLENVYCLSPLVAQIFVAGDSLKEFCVAIVVPDVDGWRRIDSNKYQSLEDICESVPAHDIILKELESIGRKNGLLGFEIVRKVRLCSTVMTIENELLTPILKLKRKEAANFFAKEIALMYS